jgi:hypothetical protein
MTKKIYNENEKFDRVLYSESYIVDFMQLSGQWKRETIRYFAASKDSHKEVEAKWKKKYPKAHLISIRYE